MQSEVKVYWADSTSTFEKATLYVVLEWDYILYVFALLQSRICGPIITQDAVENWIDTKESIWNQVSKDQRIPLPLWGVCVPKYAHS